MFKIYAEPESPNQGACSRYMIYNPGPENHKKYPEKTKIRPESVRLLQVLYNPGPENHKKYPKKTWTLESHVMLDDFILAPESAARTAPLASRETQMP